MIEFKYFSNSTTKAKKFRIDQFALIKSDADQIRGYAEGLCQEYPEAKVTLFVIYYFGSSR